MAAPLAGPGPVVARCNQTLPSHSHVSPVGSSNPPNKIVRCRPTSYDMAGLSRRKGPDAVRNIQTEPFHSQVSEVGYVVSSIPPHSTVTPRCQSYAMT